MPCRACRLQVRARQLSKMLGNNYRDGSTEELKKVFCDADTRISETWDSRRRIRDVHGGRSKEYSHIRDSRSTGRKT